MATATPITATPTPAATVSPPLIAEFLQFFEDIPFGEIAAVVAAGGTNIPLDVTTAEAIVAAAVKDFFGGASATKAATTVAIAAGVPPSAAPASK